MTAITLGRRTRAAASALGLVYTGAVLWLTLRPLPWATDGNQETFGILDPQAWIGSATWTQGSALEIAANVLLFVPVGLASGLVFRGLRSAITPLALTLLIELVQIPLADRISHPRDLVANACGALLGLATAAAIRRRHSAFIQEAGADAS